jgi:hypothetical protein
VGWQHSGLSDLSDAHPHRGPWTFMRPVLKGSSIQAAPGGEVVADLTPDKPMLQDVLTKNSSALVAPAVTGSASGVLAEWPG